MARWTPPDKIENNEHVGRRLFDEPLLIGAQDQKPFKGLDLRHFEEKRDRETSLDRLGRSNVERAVINYLLPRAESAATQFKPEKIFNGWAYLKAKDLMFPPKGIKYSSQVVASPISEKDLAENIYHAHIVMPDDVDHYSMALHLRNIFCSYGSVHNIENKGSLSDSLIEKIKSRIVTALAHAYSGASRSPIPVHAGH
jgi:hypothetical protein